MVTLHISEKYHYGKFPGKSASIRPPTAKNWTKLDQMTLGSPKKQYLFRKGARKCPKSGRFSHSAESVATAPAHHLDWTFPEFMFCWKWQTLLYADLPFHYMAISELGEPSLEGKDSKQSSPANRPTKDRYMIGYSSSSFINHANSCERANELGRLT